MDHTLAQQTKSIDKYLLNELTDEERLAFEEHMFDCPDCAAQVKDDFAMIADLKSVLGEPRPMPAEKAVKPESGWRHWFRPMMLVPTFATLALAWIVGYQHFVSIPAMLRPQLLDVAPFVAATRGATIQTAIVKADATLFVASFEVVTAKPAPAYVCEFQADSGSIVAMVDCGKHAGTEFTLSVLLPVSKFPAGGYTMILRPALDSHSEVSRYSFAVKTGN